MALGADGVAAAAHTTLSSIGFLGSEPSAGLLLGTFRGASPVHRLSGGGTIDWTEDLRVKYGFAAMVDASGNGRGVLQFDYREGGFRWHGDITCLNVVGNRAWASGVFTAGTHEGQYFFFGAEDNGEGVGASEPDLISLIYYSATPRDCRVNMPIPYQGWTNGNVQIENLAGDPWYVEDDEPGV